MTPVRHGGLCLVQTTDFFYPLVDDPYMMGKIACANVLSDLYAMGVTECDNMLMLLGVSTKMTEKERDVVIPLIMRGFKDSALEAGTTVTGGQTVVNPWCTIGGVATTVCQPNEYIVPDNAVVGDVLVLTKPLGTQVRIFFVVSRSCDDRGLNLGSCERTPVAGPTRTLEPHQISRKRRRRSQSVPSCHGFHGPA